MSAAPGGVSGDGAGGLVEGEKVIQVQVATSVDGEGRFGVVMTDLVTTQVIVVDPSYAHPQLRTGGPGGFVDDVIDLLPEPPGDTSAHPTETIDVPQEFSVALAHALKVGDTTTIAAVSEEQGWSDVPILLSQLATEHVGSAQLMVRSSGTDDLTVASLLLIPTGWVQLLPIGSDVIRHVPVSLDDLRAQVLSAVTAHAAVLSAAVGTGGDEAEGRHDAGGGDD